MSIEAVDGERAPDAALAGPCFHFYRYRLMGQCHRQCVLVLFKFIWINLHLGDFCAVKDKHLCCSFYGGFVITANKQIIF